MRNTHYLFFGFVNGRQDSGEGPEEPALRWLAAPRTEGFSLKGGLGPTRGRPCALPATIAIPEPHSVFPSLGARAQRERSAAAAIMCPPRTDPPPQGLSPVPCPPVSGPCWQKSLHMWVSSPSCLQLFLVLPAGAVSLHLHENETQRNRSR